MNIKFQTHIGEAKTVETFTPTGDKVYYRTLIFKLDDLESKQVNLFIRFLDSKIELSKVAVSSKIIVLVQHNFNIEPNRAATDHLMTLIGARILSCESLHWGFVPRANYVGYKVTIHLPMVSQRVTTDELFDALKYNDKPSVERTEIKQAHLWGQLLVWLRVRKRKYSVVINGSSYDV